VADVKAAGGRAIAVAADMGREADIVRLFEETDKAFGPLTGLVNNAAINTPSPRSIADYTFQ
jgi:NAD(P)-dependent dehydrogenase (short-subunit alcohol dehydrogenase family)